MENEKLNNYYKDLPPHFREDYCIDATKSSIGVMLNVIALLIAAVVGVATYFARFGIHGTDYNPLNLLYNERDAYIGLAAMFSLVVGLFVYLIVHELTHGLFYKLLTKQKLRFGLTLTVAYCGLKEGYVNKKTALISVLAPFVIHSIWMIIAIFLIRVEVVCFVLIIIFALHFGGCCGDLWVSALLIFKYRNRQVLMCDNGPKQQFFVYDENAPEYPQTEAQQNETVSLFGSAYVAEEKPAKDQTEQNEDNSQS